MDKKRVVIALGGNALGKDIEEQKQAVAKTAEVIVDLVQQGTHQGGRRGAPWQTRPPGA